MNDFIEKNSLYYQEKAEVDQRTKLCLILLDKVKRYLCPSISRADILRSSFMLIVVKFLKSGYRSGGGEKPLENEYIETEYNKYFKNVIDLSEQYNLNEEVDDIFSTDDDMLNYHG